ncbi:uncharacterized protein LOC127833367 [Dreissena polymorpha]|uniref:TNF family profile domain-containing protein n=1 Tax=Dreissena polymorpha TaxID=45954 RepID=A0A9D4G8Y7_DREPO|nr:uncharacterized protein LOC127833367 [Dreissena polymorpha]KAH3810750.1 hypothetical protein DPMN_139147 [Dreissena polymorpha]
MNTQSHVKAMDLYSPLPDAHRYYAATLGINTEFGCNVNSITNGRIMKLVRQSSTVEPLPGNGDFNVGYGDSLNIHNVGEFGAYINRQNSVNEEREKERLMKSDESSLCVDLEHSPKLPADGQSQKVKVFNPDTEEYALSLKKDDELYTEKRTEDMSETCNNSPQCGDVECGKETQREAVSSRRRTLGLLFIGFLVGCLLTCAVLIPVHIQIMQQRYIPPEPSPPLYLESHSDEWPTFIELTRPAGDTRPLAKFLLDQETLYGHGTIRWKAASETLNSTITASGNESCVIVPEDGFYCVLSQLTYAFTGSTMAKQVGHSLLVVHDGAENVVQKKLITVPFRDTSLPRNQKVLEPSNLLTYVLTKAGDKICVNAEPPELLYVAPLDNVLIVVKQ